MKKNVSHSIIIIKIKIEIETNFFKKIQVRNLSFFKRYLKNSKILYIVKLALSIFCSSHTQIYKQMPGPDIDIRIKTMLLRMDSKSFSGIHIFDANIFVPLKFHIFGSAYSRNCKRPHFCK